MNISSIKHFSNKIDGIMKHFGFLFKQKAGNAVLNVCRGFDIVTGLIIVPVWTDLWGSCSHCLIEGSLFPERKTEIKRKRRPFSWGLGRRAPSPCPAPALSSASVYVSDRINLILIYTWRVGWEEKPSALLSDPDDRGLLLFQRMNGE